MTPADGLGVRLLGGFEVEVGGRPVALGGNKARAVFAMLALAPGRTVSTGRLVEGLWGDRSPDRAVATIQVYVSGLRKALALAGADRLIVTDATGYRLDVDPGSIDAERFEKAATDAQDALRWSDDRLALHHLQAALAEWGGDPLGEFDDLTFAAGPRAAFLQRHQAVITQRIEVLLRLGEHRAALPEIEAALSDHQLDESLWRALALALYRSGRQADALAALRQCHDLLVEALGVSPSPETRQLELAVLEQDPALLEPRSRPPERGAMTVPAGDLTTLVIVVDGRRHPCGGLTTLGRSDDSDIVLDDARVSRRHAEIRRHGGSWELADLSLNGTFVNGERVQVHELVDGDRITIGDTDLSVEVETI